jgi:D-glycero-alpha-D-manno-heptose-7-phosphate kinase
MIIAKTPFRISFLGGGTDYPEYFVPHGGAVLGTAIGLSAYHSVSRFYSRLFDYTIRVAYRQVECVKALEELQHTPFRECLRRCGFSSEIEVSYTAELPSFSGMGTSSAFVVGLLNALHAFRGKTPAAMELAYEAIEMERQVLGECVGCQDQTFAAAGGFNVIEFHELDDIRVHPVGMSADRLREFEDHLLIFYTGVRRRADGHDARQVDRHVGNRERLARMRRLVDRGHSILTGAGKLCAFGQLLDENWRLKAELDPGISNGVIDAIYTEGLEAGALGGKLLGAGGGGFVLFFVPPERKPSVRQRLSRLEEIPVRINAPGSHILQTDQHAANGFSGS